jgi:hypothetical protein
VKYYLATSDEILCTLKAHLKQERKTIKQQADKRRIDREFMIGDWVFIQLQPYKQNSLKNYKKHKLDPKFMDLIKFERESVKLLMPLIFQIKENCMMLSIFLV